ncbi:MAG: DNA translocase FtsK [Gemmataceae bacterium]|nr:DNA translocase FtsK [Gemmataceae bacterium]
MTQLWCEQQRQALLAFRLAITDRARRETEIASEEQSRTRANEQHHAARKQKADSVHAAAQSDAINRVEMNRRQILERQEREREELRQEHEAAREAHLAEYREAKEALEAEFREARWTTGAVYEADKRVAKEQMLEAMASCRELLRKLLVHWRGGRTIIDNLEFLDDIPALDVKAIHIGAGDPFVQIQQCADRAAADVDALQTMRSPRFINGWLPWLILVAVWLVITAPSILGAIFFVGHLIPYWLIVIAAPAIMLPIGNAMINRMRSRTNDRILSLWFSLRESAHLARKLRPICYQRAKKKYLTKKRQSLQRNRDLQRTMTEKTRASLEELREKRDKALHAIERTFKKRYAVQGEQQPKEAATIDESLEKDQRQASQQYDADCKFVENEYRQKREANHQWHTQQWTALLRDWKQACDGFLQTCKAVARDCEQWFPPWDKPLTLPKALPMGLPIGQMHWTLDMFPGGVPSDPQLPRPDLSKATYPALLPFPQRASVLYRTHGEARQLAIDALQALLLHCWTAMPAGKVRATIIDPVGRGENFSAFMHLADHDEKLIDYRIWTELSQVDERLSNLTLHMENVLQKYLRNEYETLAEYNAQAGEVAEPFHFLVIAHFPVNFSEDAARRLVSLASAGARCGIYTFVMVDLKQPMPHGFNLADLEKVCTCLYWEKDRFLWEDTDFGEYPLTLSTSPEPARCTELLKQVGDEAVRSSKVEVPFEWIMPVRDTWWHGDTANGIRVPIGRFGAQGKQYLELGLGTSQHVLVAGKTGSGKSTLLHVLISQLAMFYSPREIELYLIDFKKGVEFKAYASFDLPHAKVIAVESEREFGLSVLQKLDGELSKRGEIYRSAGVNDLATYREHAKSHPEVPYLPRVMLIVDEFQEFFIEDDKIAGESSLLMDRLVRQGRAFGIHVLLGSQTIGGAYSLARSTIDQMAVRIALQCSEADAHLILSRDNTEARLLSRPGEGIYNAMHGMLEGNHMFQVVWLGDNKRDELLTQVHAMVSPSWPVRKPIVFEGAIPADLATNHLLIERWKSAEPSGTTSSAWLGDAIAIKDPTAAVFRKQSGSNLLILGQQEDLAIGLTVSSLISLSALSAEPCVDLVIGQALDAASEELVKTLTDTLPIRLWPLRELGALLNQLAAEIDRRSQLGGPPRFLFLYGLQRLRDLRKPDDDFGFSKKGEDKTPYRQFTHVLKEGPPVGVFTLLWCDTLVNLQRMIDRPTMREFDQRVMMQMSAADSSTLMDSPIAAKLGPQRALYFTEDQGRIEKFRPYALPSAEWIQSLPGLRS